MIRINEFVVQTNRIDHEFSLGSMEKYIFERLAHSHKLNRYDSLYRLNFELKLRTYIIDSAKLLNQSGVSYATFEQSFCNPNYWHLQNNGGFKLKPNVSPSAAIQDIYTNGSQYAFECATAMVIVFYKAVLHAIHETHFNRLFADILLWDWHYDKDLNITTMKTNEFIPGDVLYFKNPDVNPITPEWQGENVVYLERDTYYGHGIGIRNAQQMIAALNARRKPGSLQSAYLLDQSTRPGFQYLSQFEGYNRGQSIDRNVAAHFPSLLIARIGSHAHILS